jgi:ATP-dependent helicase HrpB
MQPLPIDELLPEIVEALEREPRLIVQAPPGTGKSTRIPVALQRILKRPTETIVVAEPRRIAARMLANRVASELEEDVGNTVGYRVRFEKVGNRHTTIIYATSGVLLRQLVADPHLTGVGCLIVDEFHERHLDTDLLLALALHAQGTTRRDLKIVVMSATIDAERVQVALGGCRFISSSNRPHPTTIDYGAEYDERPLEKKVASALRSLLQTGPPGDILVFLPGAREIRNASEQLTEIAGAHELELLALHGEMTLARQAAVMEPSVRQKVVLTTNLAESSITVPGVANVIDSGLARRAVCSPWSGLVSLELHRISRASATQRAGRAGRLSPGRVTRLYTRRDYETRSEFETPEILRMDLCEAILLTRGVGIACIDDLKCVDRPTASQVSAAEQLLCRLGAITTDGQLSEIGNLMLRLPLHPRLARLVVQAQQKGIVDLGCLVAALLSERDLRLDFRVYGPNAQVARKSETGDSDVLELVEAFDLAASLKYDASRCARERIDGPLARRVADAKRQLRECLPRSRGWEADPVDVDITLGQALLRAFPDRVAWRRHSGQAALTLANGVSARISEQSVVREARYLLAIDADDKSPKGSQGSALVRIACRVDPNWLLDLNDPFLQTEERYYWADPPGRVENQSLIRYGSIILDESHAPVAPSAMAAKVLATVAIERGVLRGDALTSLRERLSLLAKVGLISAESLPTESDVIGALETLCHVRVNLEGLDASAVAEELTRSMGSVTARGLNIWAPDSYRLPTGRSVKVHYQPDCAPWIESRLQDFFGMAETPRIADNRQPLTLHLLAPNRRAVQVTQDLSGFWERHYPSIRRELMRRYPKHMWPADGRTAVPTPMRPHR